MGCSISSLSWKDTHIKKNTHIDLTCPSTVTCFGFKNEEWDADIQPQGGATHQHFISTASTWSLQLTSVMSRAFPEDKLWTCSDGTTESVQQTKRMTVYNDLELTHHWHTNTHTHTLTNTHKHSSAVTACSALRVVVSQPKHTRTSTDNVRVDLIKIHDDHSCRNLESMSVRWWYKEVQTMTEKRQEVKENERKLQWERNPGTFLVFFFIHTLFYQVLCSVVYVFGAYFLLSLLPLFCMLFICIIYGPAFVRFHK